MGTLIEGGTTIRDYDANLNTSGNHINFIVPVYVREGAIIPTVELEQYVGQLNQLGMPNPITLNIYPGQSGFYNMYLDDGVSRSSAPTEAHPAEFGGDEQAKGEYRQTQISHTYTAAQSREIKVVRVHDNYTPKYEKYFFVAILHDPSETKGISGCLNNVKIAGLVVNKVPDGSALAASSVNAWYYNDSINISFIKVFDSSSISLVVEYH